MESSHYVAEMEAGVVDSVNLNYLAALEGDKVRATNCYSMQSSSRGSSVEGGAHNDVTGGDEQMARKRKCCHKNYISI